MLTTRADIMTRLTKYCQTIRVESEIIVIGAASIILNIGTGRGTHDIDIISKVYTEAITLYDIDIVSEGILFLPRDYRTRLIFHGRVGVVTIYALHPLDVALVKLGRGLERDLNDISDLLINGIISPVDFKNLYMVFRSGYGGSYEVIDRNFYSVTGIKVPPEPRMF